MKPDASTRPGTAEFSTHRRRAVVGLVAGTLSSYPLAATLGHPAAAVLFGALGGAAYALTNPPENRSRGLDGAFAAAALGVPLWGAVSVYTLPILAGEGPQWTADGMRALLPALLGWLLTGFLVGMFVPLGRWLAARWLGPEPATEAPAPPDKPQRVLILGGGFAGMGVASELERLFGADPAVEFTLVSETNALLFTPMLTEVAASSLEPTHISAPLRTSLRRTRVVRGRVVDLDLDRRRVRAHRPGSLDGHPDEFSYDHLVLALGSAANHLGNDAVRRHSLDFKSLNDAIRVRNTVIAAFDAADAEPDPARRRARLTFVIAGAGFSGAELAGALNDFARGMLADYPRLSADDLRVIVVHSRERILPELSPPLGAYALERMEARGVTFRLNCRLVDARPDAVTIQAKSEEGQPPAAPEEIAAMTLVWTAGVAPSPVLKALPVEHDQREAVVTKPTMAVGNWPGVWALGDCASVPDAKTGKPCPGTAQFAVRQAPHLARNIHAVLHNREPEGFHFDALGTLCVVGHQTACAEILGHRFSGFFAWLLWRGVYWAKLPGLERKVRVLGDWIIELFFPRDIVQTLVSDHEPRGDNTSLG